MQGLIKLGDEHPDKKKEFDFHWRTAISVWGPEATKENRYTAKRINFQKMYGGKAPGCAKAIGIPLNVASKVFDAFDALAPRYVAWDQEMRAAVSGGRESMTLYSGRDVYFGHKGEHAAGNTAIQGTAREFLVDGIMKWRQSKWKDCLAIPVHDEVIVFDVPEGEADEATACLVDCLHTWLNGVEIVAEANKPSPFWCDASLFADYARNSARLRLCQLRGIDARRVLTPTVAK
jgi:DNA polymerase I-like protein with 3'-5' exonuclease and polymerase domains